MFDWIDGLFADAESTVKTAVSVIVLVLVVVLIAKARLGVASSIIALLMGGFVVWLVRFDGLVFVAGLLNTETAAAGLVTTVL
jgi:hypothetical protein